MKQLFEIQGPVNVTGWQSARSCRQRKLHMLTWPALLLQPPPLRIFTMTPNCPPTHTHFPWSLRGTNWHIYMLMFPIGYTSSSPFFFSFCLLSAQSPTLSAPRAFFTAPVFFHHHLLPLWLILNSSPLGYIWPGDLKHITLPPSLLPHLPPSLSPSE